MNPTSPLFKRLHILKLQNLQDIYSKAADPLLKTICSSTSTKPIVRNGEVHVNRTHKGPVGIFSEHLAAIFRGTLFSRVHAHSPEDGSEKLAGKIFVFISRLSEQKVQFSPLKQLYQRFLQKQCYGFLENFVFKFGWDHMRAKHFKMQKPV